MPQLHFYEADILWTVSLKLKWPSCAEYINNIIAKQTYSQQKTLKFQLSELNIDNYIILWNDCLEKTSFRESYSLNSDTKSLS